MSNVMIECIKCNIKRCSLITLTELINVFYFIICIILGCNKEKTRNPETETRVDEKTN